MPVRLRSALVARAGVVSIAAALAIALLCASSVSAQVIVKDDKTFFDAVVPANWAITRPTDPEDAKVLRWQATAPDKQSGVYFYVFEADYDIDLEKFESIDSKLGWALGAVASDRTISDSKRERRYKRGPKGLYAAALFQVDGPNGYVVLAVSANPDLSFGDQVFQTFAIRTPMSSRISRWFVRYKNQWTNLFWFVIVVVSIVAIKVIYHFARRTFGPRPSLAGSWTAQFVDALGIAHLPPKRQGILVDRFSKILLQRMAGRRRSLSPEDRKLFEFGYHGGQKGDDKESEARMEAFLQQGGADLMNRLLQEEGRKLLNEVKQNAVKLTASADLKDVLGQVRLESVVEVALEVAENMD